MALHHGCVELGMESDSCANVLAKLLREQQWEQQRCLDEWSRQLEKRISEEFVTVCRTIRQCFQGAPLEQSASMVSWTSKIIVRDTARDANVVASAADEGIIRCTQIPKPQACFASGVPSPNSRSKGKVVEYVPARLPPTPVSLPIQGRSLGVNDYSCRSSLSNVAETSLSSPTASSSEMAKMHDPMWGAASSQLHSASSIATEPETPSSPPIRATARRKSLGRKSLISRLATGLTSRSGSMENSSMLALPSGKTNRQSLGALASLFHRPEKNPADGLKRTITTALEQNFAAPVKADAESRSILSNIARLVRHRYFEGLCALVIVLNAANFGLSANFAVTYRRESDLYSFFELSFSSFYTFELLLRLIVYHVHFFWNEEWAWNYLDLILVVTSMYEQVVKYVSASSMIGNITIIRMLRIIKMFKLLRMFRLLRMFKELRLLLNAILGSMKSMIWSILLVINVTYVFGIVFLQAGTTCMIEEYEQCQNPDFQADFLKDWGSVEQSMLSLFMAVTGGVDWFSTAFPLQSVGMAYYVVFLLYIAFFNFIILNTLTSLFLEATLSNAEKDHHTVILNELKKKEAYVNKLKQLFSRIETSGDIEQEITIDELKDRMRDPEMYAFASSMEIDLVDIEQFFRILSADGTQRVDLESFVVGCMKLRGQARSMDLMGLVYSQKKFMKYCTKEFGKITEKIARLQKRVGIEIEPHDEKDKARMTFKETKEPSSQRPTAAASITEESSIGARRKIPSQIRQPTLEAVVE